MTYEQRRALGRELRKLARAIELGQVWTPAQGLRATQLTHQLRGECFQARLDGDKAFWDQMMVSHRQGEVDRIAAAHAGFEGFVRK